MQLLVIRHGPAEEAPTAAATEQGDMGPPLSKAGKQLMKDVADGLLELVEKVDVISASPLLRAQQTAAIIANAYNDPPIATVRELLPEGDPSALEIRLRQHSKVNVVAIVGHEPHLGVLVTWLMSGVKSSRVALSKGSTCLIEFSGGVAAGGGTLQWLLTPSQLRRIGR